MKSRLSTTLFLVIVAGLLILASSLIYWVAVARPAQLHAQATATAARDATATSIAQVRSTAQAEAQATSLVISYQILLGEIYNKATSGTPTITDPLQAQDSNNWENDPPDESPGSCAFVAGIYRLKIAAGDIETCLAGATNFSNLAFQVEMRIVSGHSGGLVIRSDANDSGYYFRISTDGTFLGRSVLVKPNVGSIPTDYYTPLFAGQSPAVKTGNDQFNQITVIALGSELYMYVNQQFVAKISDSTYTSGRIGVYADSDINGSEILFRNAQVWKLYSAAQHFTAKGTVTIGSSTTTGVRQDGNNTIYSLTVQEVLYGDITGSFTSEETSIVHPDNTASFSGRSTCTCTVAGKSGTLMWSFTGTSTANGSFQGQDFDVHGTGDLAKLHGQGVFQGQGTHETYSSELYFDA